MGSGEQGQRSRQERASGCQGPQPASAQGPLTPRAPARTNGMEKPTQTSSIPAGCPRHEAACHHRCCRKGKEQPPQPLPTPLLTATLTQAGAVGRPVGNWSGTPAGAGRLPAPLPSGRQQPCVGWRLGDMVAALPGCRSPGGGWGDTVAALPGCRSPGGRCRPGQQRGVGGLDGARDAQSWARTLPALLPSAASRVGASEGGSAAPAGQGRGATAAAMGCTRVAEASGEQGGQGETRLPPPLPRTRAPKKLRRGHGSAGQAQACGRHPAWQRAAVRGSGPGGRESASCAGETALGRGSTAAAAASERLPALRAGSWQPPGQSQTPRPSRAAAGPSTPSPAPLLSQGSAAPVPRERDCPGSPARRTARCPGHGAAGRGSGATGTGSSSASEARKP